MNRCLIRMIRAAAVFALVASISQLHSARIGLLSEPLQKIELVQNPPQLETERATLSIQDAELKSTNRIVFHVEFTTTKGGRYFGLFNRGYKNSAKFPVFDEQGAWVGDFLMRVEGSVFPRHSDDWTLLPAGATVRFKQEFSLEKFVRLESSGLPNLAPGRYSTQMIFMRHLYSRSLRPSREELRDYSEAFRSNVVTFTITE